MRSSLDETTIDCLEPKVLDPFRDGRHLLQGRYRASGGRSLHGSITDREISRALGISEEQARATTEDSQMLLVAQDWISPIRGNGRTIRDSVSLDRPSAGSRRLMCPIVSRWFAAAWSCRSTCLW